MKGEGILEKTRAMAYFALYGFEEHQGDFLLEEVTNKIGIEPTYTTKIGDPLPNHSNRTYLSTSWNYETDYIETLDVDEVLLPVIHTLKPKVKEIQYLIKAYQLHPKISIVIEIKDGHTPGLVISTESCQFAAEIGANVEIDLYASPYTVEDE